VGEYLTLFDLPKLPEKKQTKAPVFSYSDYSFFTPEFAEIWKDFEKLRVKKKRPLTDRAVKLNLNEIRDLSAGSNGLALKILERTIKKGWDGFFPLPVETPGNNNNTPQENTDAQIGRAERARLKRQQKSHQ
jgi:hypothetical protein